MNNTDDKRTDNNVMRHEYRALSDEEKSQMKLVKDMGLAFIEVCNAIGVSTNPLSGEVMTAGSRELSLAKTKMEEAVFWAVKAITK